MLNDYQKFHHYKGVSKIYTPLIHLLHSFLITEESTPKSLFKVVSTSLIIIRITLRFFQLTYPLLLIHLHLYCHSFLFGYILVIYFCWLMLCLLLVDIFRFFSKSCFLRINILSIIRRCIKRIIKLSFFF